MKNKFFASLILTISILFFACDKEEDSKDPNIINGETNIGINTVGNSFGASVKVGNTNTNIWDSVYIVSNNNGII
ncbi:MAG: hypothetical protein OZ915_03600, partial [Ignavibacteriales bacterium]|nr:hypothetical protein [Ignavibacteriales bacterium]